jgi:putative effector of murein hydrolase
MTWLAILLGLAIVYIAYALYSAKQDSEDEHQ